MGSQDTFKASIDAVKGRLREAAQTQQALRLKRHSFPDGYTSVWPQVIHDTVEAYGWEGDPWGLYGLRQPRLANPSPAKIDRMDEVLGWLLWLDGQARRLVWARACRIKWRYLERARKLSRQTLTKQHDEALAIILLRLIENDI